MTPLEMSAKVDEYFQAREVRLAADKEAAKLKETETKLKDELIRALSESQLTSLGGKLARVTIQQKIKPITTSWAEVYEYIQQNQAWDLIQKRLTETAVKARWEDGIKIPGIGEFPVLDLSIAKP
jgi:methionyl-tRNA synthetase